MDKGQASVDPDRCIACGTCIRECPQKAKSFRNDLEKVRALVAQKPKVAISIAPSFASAFNDWELKKIPSALRSIGFSYIAETSVGAYWTALESLNNWNKNNPALCTACPAFVLLVEKYYPDLVEFLLPVASPMMVHGRMIKKKLGNDCAVVFAGPCVAKKVEAEKADGGNVIDAVITFQELENWFFDEKIRLDLLEDSSFDDSPIGSSRLFPLPGGLVKTAGENADCLSGDIISVNGSAEIMQLLEGIRERRIKGLIEPLFCSQGCINGPAFGTKTNLFQRRNRILKYNPECSKPESDKCSVTLAANYCADKLIKTEEFSEQQIKEVLAATGKVCPSDELDCQACGYESCREKAKAVLRGFAEIEMCVPYMRRMAERRTDRIIETSPNGIVVLDQQLKILSMNKAFREMFLCSKAGLGRHISFLVDPQPFEIVLAGKTGLTEGRVEYSKYGLVTHQIVYRLEIEKQLIGIFVNITGSEKSQQQLDELKANIIGQARDMLDHQIDMSQQIARFLGENTAKGEILIENLARLAGEDESETPIRKGVRWGTFMLK
jgi:iron only hydrogenase large subunit-like protein